MSRIIDVFNHFFKKKVPVSNVIYENKMLENKNVLITGASSGIGLEIAKKFALHGANIIIVGTNKKKLDIASNEILHCKPIIFDLSEVEKIDLLVEQCESWLKPGGIDVLVNCAGVNDKQSFYDVSVEEFEKIFKVNVEATFFLSRAVGKRMIDNKIKGSILNISSSSSARPAVSPYKISKWAIRGMTLGLAELFTPYEITVNAIAPGKTATPMLGGSNPNDIASNQPCGRLLMPEEIADLAVFMVSGAGKMIIGDTVFISGGNGTIMI